MRTSLLHAASREGRQRVFGRRSPGRPRSAADRRPAAEQCRLEDQVVASLGGQLLGDGAHQVDVALLLGGKLDLFEGCRVGLPAFGR